MDGDVTGVTDHQRFALACCHHADPQRPFGLPVASQVLERTNVMHLDLVLCATQLTGLCQEASFEFRSGSWDVEGCVIEDCASASCQ